MKYDFVFGGQSPNGRDGVHVTNDEAMAELQRVMDSPDFETSPRNRAFLKLAVESTLAGRRIGGYDVAVEAFGRPRTFNASKDPIVRIECSKLRKALEIYYLKSGRHNPLRLTIPKGGYRVVFRQNETRDQTGVDREVRLDAESAALLRAAIAGWAGPRVRGFHAQAPQLREPSTTAELLQTIRVVDPILHDLVEEGLHRFGRQARSPAQVAEVVL